MRSSSTGLSLAKLYAEQDEETPSNPPITWDRPRWELPDYDRLKATDLKHELMLGRAWNEVAAYLSPKNIDINTVKSPSDHQNSCLKHIIDSSHDAPPILIVNFLDEVTRSFNWIEADIKRCMVQLEMTTSLSRGPKSRSVDVLNALFDKLYRWEKEWNTGMKWIDMYFKPPMNVIKNYAQTHFRAHFQALLYDILPSPTFHDHLKSYFESTLPPLRPFTGDSNDPVRSEFTLPNRYIYRIGLLPKYATMLADVAYEQLGRIARSDWDPAPAVAVDGDDSMEVEEDEENEWGERVLDGLRQVVKRDLLGWLFGYLEAGGPQDRHRRNNIEIRMEYRLQTEFYDHRCRQMFDIIVNFPESMGALLDMKACTALTLSLRRIRLAPVLNESIRQRLLHPGAETKDIIRGYVLIIKALRVIDGTGVLLHTIAQPIRAYLKSRSDTVASIVSMLVETEELSDVNDRYKIQEIQIKHELAEEWIDNSWEPEPIDASPEFRAKKANDILSTLVGIYETRDVVVTELQMWLARRLLEVKEYEFEEDFAKVEMLKKRFGDTTLQVCEVMLKDMTDSKRINGQVQRVQENPLKPIILSHHYWPNVASKTLKLPKVLRKLQDDYIRSFGKVKQDKHLKFFNMLGTVQLTVELEDRTIDMEVTPLQATVLDAFSKRDRYTWQEMGTRIRVKEQKVVQHALNFWVNEGVLKLRDDGTYVSLDGNAETPGDTSIILDDAEEAALESPRETLADMEIHRWTEIQKLLASGVSFSTFILHRLLSRDPTYENTKESLERFLGETARTGLLENSDKGWRLPLA